MRGAIASVEIFAWERVVPGKVDAAGPRRLTLVIGSPTRDSGDPGASGTAGESGWTCRVALADLKRPVEMVGADSLGALSAALARGEAWLEELRSAGFLLTRDRAGREPYVLGPADSGHAAGGASQASD